MTETRVRVSLWASYEPRRSLAGSSSALCETKYRLSKAIRWSKCPEILLNKSFWYKQRRVSLANSQSRRELLVTLEQLCVLSPRFSESSEELSRLLSRRDKLPCSDLDENYNPQSCIIEAITRSRPTGVEEKRWVIDILERNKNRKIEEGIKFCKHLRPEENSIELLS